MKHFINNASLATFWVGRKKPETAENFLVIQAYDAQNGQRFCGSTTGWVKRGSLRKAGPSALRLTRAFAVRWNKSCFS
jgi:hypothetical protein